MGLTNQDGILSSGWIITFNFDFSFKLECAGGPFQLWIANTLLLETGNILRNCLRKIQARKIDHLTSVSSVHLTIGSYVNVRSSRYESRGKFGEHERCVRVALGVVESNSSFLSALQTSQVLHISMNAQLTYEPIEPDGLNVVKGLIFPLLRFSALIILFQENISLRCNDLVLDWSKNWQVNSCV